MTEPQIFIASDLPIEAFVAEVAEVLGKSFEVRHYEDEPDVYVHQSDGLGLMLYRHDYENDADLVFDAHQYCIDIAGGPTRADVDRQARALYAELRADGRYPLMLVDDVQFEIDRFTPSSVPSHSPEAPQA